MKSMRKGLWLICAALAIVGHSGVALAQPPAPAKSKLDTEEEESPLPKKPAGTTDATTSRKPGAPEEEEPIAPPPRVPVPGSAAVPGARDTASELDTVEVYDKLWYRKEHQELSLKLQLFAAPPRIPGLFGDSSEFPLWPSKPRAKSIVHIDPRNLIHVEFFESRVLEQAKDVLGKEGRDLQRTGKTFDLSQPLLAERVKRARYILEKAIAEHDSAVGRNLRWAGPWAATLRQPLVAGYFNLRLSEVDHLITGGQLPEAQAICDQLLELAAANDATRPELRKRFERIILPQVEEAIAGEDYTVARKLLTQMETRFTDDEGSASVMLRQRLVDMANNFMRQAKSLTGAQSRAAAELLEKAGRVWPQLPGLEAARHKVKSNYTILECAYTELPNSFSPLAATSPVERHANSLLFESLVRWIEDPRAGPHYAPLLSAGRPTPLARGRSFQLPFCKWSDSTMGLSHACTLEDVRWTLRLMDKAELPGSSSARSQWIEGVENPTTSDPREVVIRLRHDYWQPLALMDFMILPQHCFPAEGTKDEWAAFNERPVGTGPFQLLEKDTDLVRFVANPLYRTPGKPKIREIGFHRLEPLQSVDLFLQDKIHLVFDLRPEHVAQLARNRKADQVHTLQMPSVYFLAPNYHRPGPLRDNKELRLAIAHAIDRRAILDKIFRPGRKPQDVAELTGPFPRKSWAYNEKAPGFSTVQAKVHAERVLQAPVPMRPLDFYYPSGNPETEAACKQIEASLAALKIPVKVTAEQPEKFYQRVVGTQHFDLAYWRHDFADETYWLGELLNPEAKARGHSNFMGYQPDKETAGLLQDLKRHKRFPHVQALTHAIHDHLARNAVVIPLWQVDTYVAVSPKVKNFESDRYTLFHNVQNWTLELDEP